MKLKAIALASALIAVALPVSQALASDAGTNNTYTTSWTAGHTDVTGTQSSYYNGISDQTDIATKDGVEAKNYTHTTSSQNSGDATGTFQGTFGGNLGGSLSTSGGYSGYSSGGGCWWYCYGGSEGGSTYSNGNFNGGLSGNLGGTMTLADNRANQTTDTINGEIYHITDTSINHIVVSFGGNSQSSFTTSQDFGSISNSHSSSAFSNF